MLNVCYLIAAVGAVWILIEAFKVSVFNFGILAFIIPYKIYFAFAKLHHPRKILILSLWLGGGCVGVILNIILAIKNTLKLFETIKKRTNDTRAFRFYTSRFLTSSACSSMYFRRGSTSSPIRIEKSCSA